MKDLTVVIVFSLFHFLLPYNLKKINAFLGCKRKENDSFFINLYSIVPDLCLCNCLLVLRQEHGERV